MMTRTALKALWVGGGGLLATWLAVSPNESVPTMPTSGSQHAPAAATERAHEEDLETLTERLMSRSGSARIEPSSRNPFRFGGEQTLTPAGRGAAEPEPLTSAAPVMPAPPPLTLTGVASKHTPDGARRTAVIVSGDQIYVVGEGESVAGQYTVVTVDPEAVLLRDQTGAEIRLVLR